MSTVKQGDIVQVHYTGTIANGEKFDSSVGREPLEFTVGAGQMIAGFDAGVVGMIVGDKKQINIAPADGYGEWDEANTFPFPVVNFPADMKLEIGLQLTMRNDQGQPFPVTIAAITEENVTLDANHFLAGKDLVFDIEMMAINPGQSRIIMP